MCTYTNAHVILRQGRGQQSVFFNGSSLYIWRKGPLLNMELMDSAALADSMVVSSRNTLASFSDSSALTGIAATMPGILHEHWGSRASTPFPPRRPLTKYAALMPDPLPHV